VLPILLIAGGEINYLMKSAQTNMSERNELKEQLLEMGLEEVVVMEGYDDCVIGVLERFGTEPVILYDRDRVIDKLIADGLTPEEAVEFYEYNQLGSWVGDRTPGFLVRLPTDSQYPIPSALVN